MTCERERQIRRELGFDLVAAAYRAQEMGQLTSELDPFSKQATPPAPILATPTPQSGRRRRRNEGQ
ncbi:hypothetical protein [Chitinimonas lacunae]|uniref:Uncharacterized protein n=1 Tax=Chitinimonas lacunae TaxID=1963018 RepID=A0ABV8MTW5_9NEIS